MGFTVTTTGGVAELVMDHPPVNALTVAGWFELAEHPKNRKFGHHQMGGRQALRAPQAWGKATV